MGKYQDLLSEVLDEIKERKGEEKMKRVFARYRESGKEAMSQEVICQILTDELSPKERTEFFEKHPEIRTAYECRLKKQ